MRLEVGPAEIHVVPGTPAAVVAQVFNSDDVINAYEIRVFGVDPEWVQLERERLSLFPSSAGVVTVLVNVPEDYPAGSLRLGVEVTPLVDRSLRQLGEVTVVVAPRRIATMHADPAALISGRKGSFNLTFANDGNTPFSLELGATDPEAKVKTRFSAPTVDLVPGEQVVVPVRTQARQPIFGAPASRLITFEAKGADNPLETLVSFVQRPLIGRGLMSLVGLLVAISVFALVLTTTLNKVVNTAKVDQALLQRAVEGPPGAASVLANPGKATGKVSLLTSGAPQPGVTVELFVADDPTKVVAQAATDDKGEYTVDGLDEGTYKARFHGAGFAELWFDGALTFEDATKFDVVLGQATTDISMTIGGIPGSIAGVVLADDVKDATVSLLVPGLLPEAQIQQVVVAPDGSFLLEKVPAPATYALLVSKPGYTTARRVVNLGAAENQEGVEVRLRKGDGVIGGVITSLGQKIGGVTVTATNTVDEVSTISLTTGDDLGKFNLRNLPTPATYTITFVKDGFATENLTVALTAAEQLIDDRALSIELEEGTGSISGEVQLKDSGPQGGVTVTVSDGETTVSTETLSEGLVGSYIVSGLKIPALYTLTFSGPGLASQVRSVDLDPASELGINVEDMNATLTAATAIVQGRVTNEDGAAGGVAIELTDGTVTLTTRSADDPAGRYAIAGIPPGTYTLTFRQTGAVPTSILVNLAAGDELTRNVVLKPQASISGTVFRSSGSGGSTTEPLVGAQVLVYKVDEFPTVVTASAITAADGTYTISDLAAPQEYIIEFAYPEGAIPQFSTRQTLAAGERLLGINATLTLAGDG